MFGIILLLQSSLSSLGPAYNTFQVDSFKLIELLGPEKVDPADVKLIKDKLFGYSTFWVTKEEPFGDLGEGILFIGIVVWILEHRINDEFRGPPRQQIITMLWSVIYFIILLLYLA